MTLRNAPLLGQDGGSCRDDLPDGRSEIFLQMGLDRQTTGLPADLPVGQISTRRFRFAPRFRRPGERPDPMRPNLNRECQWLAVFPPAAQTPNGHVSAAPPTTVMNPRRRMNAPVRSHGDIHPNCGGLQRSRIIGLDRNHMEPCAHATRRKAG
jgi:hypothetical protein